jgi:hypothetical protein
VPETYYRRYTDIPSLVGMLTNGKLTLLEPITWDDKNDSYYLEQYRLKLNLKSVLALCLSRANETYHHWRVFSPGPAGVCIWFKEEQLKAAVAKIPGLRMKSMEYLTVKNLRSKKIAASKLPFVKRFPFKPEDEVRLLWESKTKEQASLAVPFDSTAIERITLSPWLHSSLADPMKALLKSLPECRRYKVYRSTLVSNAEWKRRGREAI